MNPQQASYQLPVAPKKSNPKIIIGVLALLLVLAIGFGAWAFMGKQDYKTKTDDKIAAAVASAKTPQAATLQAQFDEKSKSPYKTFSGSATYGSITFDYPRSWSGYLDLGSGQPINAYFDKDFVGSPQPGSLYALRVELVADSYTTVLNSFSTLITAGSVTSSAYIPPKMKSVANAQIGSRLDGAITENNKSTGAIVILKVRDKTLKVYTQSPDFLADFNNVILPSLTFAP